MPGCVLRIGGNFTAAELLAQCPLPRVARADDGCVLALVSGAESSNIHTQVVEALEFLAAFSGTLQKISSLPGLGMELDFGVWLKDVPIQSRFSRSTGQGSRQPRHRTSHFLVRLGRR